MMDNNDARTLYKPQRQSECDITIELILKTKTNDKKETEVSRNAGRTK
jgi:hypothetical protein